MKNHLYRAALIPLLSACATPYLPPTLGSMARLNFTAPATEMSGLAQAVFVVSGTDCTNPLKIAGFSNLSDERAATQTIKAGSTLFLKSTLADSRTYAQLKTCVNLVSFVPLAGERYELRQRFAGKSCFTDLKEANTGRPVNTLQLHDAKVCS
jgi:hypothetical protein